MNFIGLPHGIEDDQGQCILPFNTIHRLYASTPYGEILKNNIRFIGYKPEDVSYKQWESFLGFDVNNLRHLILTHGLAKVFLLLAQHIPVDGIQNHPSVEATTADISFSREEQKIFLLTAIIHDWAEAVKGDKNYNYKTEEDESEELNTLRQLIPEVIDQNNIFINADFNAAQEVLAKKNPKLALAFNAVEHIGYFRTALRAHKMAHEKTTFVVSPVLKQGFECLTHSVFGHSVPKLLSYADHYPAVRVFLKNNSAKIVKAFNSVPEDMSDNPFRCQKPGHLNDNFVKAKALWADKGGIYLTTINQT